jgi:hypothetical protein
VDAVDTTPSPDASSDTPSDDGADVFPDVADTGADGSDLQDTTPLDGGDSSPSDTRDTTSSDTADATARASWTVLVYMAADNDLEDAAVGDLKEMLAVGGSDTLRFVVQVDRSPGYSPRAVPGLGDWTSTKRLVIDASGLREIADLGEVNTAEPAVLADFITWGINAFPADRRMLIFWNHGSGWSGFGSDESTNGHPVLSLADLKQGISQGLARTPTTAFEIIGFDACLMATYEVARAMSPFADFLLASQELEPGHGWDYRRFAALRDDPTMAPADVAADIIDGFFAQATQERSGTDLTLSLIDLTRIGQLEQALNNYATRLATTAPQDFARIGQARSNAMRFAKSTDQNREPHLVDLGDFSRPLDSLGSASAEGIRLRSVLASVVIHNRTTPVTQRASGLSIYFPRARELYDPRYDQLTEVAVWRAFLMAYYDGGTGITNPVDLTQGGTIEWTEYSALMRINVAPAVLANIVEAKGYGGLVDASRTYAQILSTFPADVGPSELRVEWFGEFALLTQGTSVELGFLDYFKDTATGQSYVDIPFLYTSPRGDVSYVVRSDTLLDNGTLLGWDIWYQFTDIGFSELWVEPGGQLTPLSFFITEEGEEWQPTTTAFDPLTPIEVEINHYFDRLTATDVVYLELQAWDFAGNFDWAGGLLPVETSTDPCDGVTEVGLCDGNDLFYCEEGQLYYIACGDYGLQCGFDAQQGYYDCL